MLEVSEIDRSRMFISQNIFEFYNSITTWIQKKKMLKQLDNRKNGSNALPGNFISDQKNALQELHVYLS